MQYRKDRYGNPISVLGYGCMRFTQTAGKSTGGPSLPDRPEGSAPHHALLRRKTHG